MAVAVFIKVLEEVFTGEVAALADDAGEFAVFQFDVVNLFAFATEMEGDLVSGDADLGIAQGGESVGAVLTGVFGIADADEAAVEQGYDGGLDFKQRGSFEFQIVSDTAADVRKLRGEAKDAAVFVAFTGGAPVGVIDVLLAATGIAAGGLERGGGGRIYPDIAPSGRDGEGFDAGEGRKVMEEFAVLGVGGGMGVVGAVDAQSVQIVSRNVLFVFQNRISN